MKKLAGVLTVLALALITAAPALRAQSLAGNWRGKVDPKTPITFHVVARGNGYAATADSKKMGATKAPATMTVNATRVSFTTSVLGAPATFIGTWDGNDTMTGSMDRGNGSTPLTLTRVARKSAASAGTAAPNSGPGGQSPGAAPQPNEPAGSSPANGEGGQSLAGNWRGKVDPQNAITLHIVAKGNAYKATAANRKSGLTKVPATITVQNGTNVSFTTSVLGASATFTGTWDGNNTITGTLNQANGSTNLTLTRAAPRQAAPGGSTGPAAPSGPHRRAASLGSAGSTASAGSSSAPSAGTAGAGPAAQSLAGNWQGKMPTGTPILFNVAAGGNGYTATADYADLSFIKVPVTVTVTRRKVSFDINYLGNAYSFSGRWTGNTITGTAQQGGAASPMTLTR